MPRLEEHNRRKEGDFVKINKSGILQSNLLWI